MSKLGMEKAGSEPSSDGSKSPVLVMFRVLSNLETRSVDMKTIMFFSKGIVLC